MLPAPIDEILPWHHSQWARMMRSRSLGRLPHALLCLGPAGVGKRHFAEHVAKALLCAAPRADGLPCSHCRDCQLFDAGSHPDYLCVEPLELAKSIRVDQVRELGDFLALTDGSGRGKIALIAPAERMTVNAANSLLKTLEEPPGASSLFLITARPSRLPATVRSRCQRVIFQIPPFEQAAAWLAERVGGADTRSLISLTEGAPLTAFACAEHGQMERRLALFEGFNDVVKGSADPVRVAEMWIEGDVEANVRWLIGWHMDMIRLKMAEQAARLLNPDLRDTLLRLAGRISAETMFRLLDSAIQLREQSTTQANRQLMFEVFLGDCAGHCGHDHLASQR